ncbi:hypothetical protein F5X71_29805 [Nocardia brasiliensis]|uniref:S-adenosyl methyltransferase n=1 Tax=Nocardia brasiliensis TaxID=37326 RepID=A0A6G9XYG7_NOCBR|nr:SAM-dependent methyltransferase [Nocardia brasiliensis]QIS05946.1 hypothetical protein F5X71_29805 [Nocardia brasiliensis]
MQQLMSGRPIYYDENGVLRDGQTNVAFRLDKPNPARIHNFWHRGKDHYPIDTRAAEELGQCPGLADAALASRTFQFDATKYLIIEREIKQFIDLGVGLPATPYLHEHAALFNSAVHVVYADFDPQVATYARALLASQRRVTYVHGDFTDPVPLLASCKESLDFSEPVAVSLVSVLEYVPGEVDALMSALRANLAQGSYLMLASLSDHASTSGDTQDRGLGALFEANGITFRSRDRTEFTELFGGFELEEPGVVAVSKWRPAIEREEHWPRTVARRKSLPGWAGLARKTASSD